MHCADTPFSNSASSAYSGRVFYNSSMPVNTRNPPSQSRVIRSSNQRTMVIYQGPSGTPERHPKYKTAHCKNYHRNNGCQYGDKCQVRVQWVVEILSLLSW